MIRKTTRTGTATLLAVLLAGCDGLLGPRNFDDCILTHMKGVTSNIAAGDIRRSCREKFPEGAELKSKSRDLKPWELSAITGRAGINYGNRYGGTLYNGNNGLTVTETRIQVTTKIEKKDVAHTYSVTTPIPPLSTIEFAIDIIVGDRNADYQWAIVGARGF